MSAIQARLQNFWAQRAEREKRILTIGAVVALPMFLTLVLIQPLIKAHGAAAEKLERKTADLVWMQAASARIKASQASAAQSSRRGDAGGGNPTTLVTRSAAQLGLNISRIEPKSDGSINIWMSKAAYAEAVEFLDSLQLQGFAIGNLTMSSHDQRGFVVLRATLLKNSRALKS